MDVKTVYPQPQPTYPPPKKKTQFVAGIIQVE